MKVAEIIPLTAASVNFALVIFVLSRGIKSVLHRVYAGWGVSIIVWNLGTAFMFSARDAHQALFWARFLQFGVIFLPVCLFHLTLLITQIRKPRLIRAIYLPPLIFAALDCTRWFVAGVHDVGYAYYTVGGPAYFVFVAVYAALTWAAMLILFKRVKKVPPFSQARIKSLLWASGILIVFGNNDIMPILGIYYYPFTHIQIFPFGSLAAIVYGLLAGYSTLQHQLLDVQVVVSRFVAHSIRLAFMFLIGLVLLLSIWAIVPGQFTPTSLFAALAVLLTSGIIASLLFPKLFGRGSEAWERRFLGDRFEYHDQIRGFISTMQWHTDTEVLLEGLNELLVKSVRVQNYRIVVRDETNRAFTVLCSYPEQAPQQVSALNDNAPIFRFFELTGAEYLGSKQLPAYAGKAELEEEARALLNQIEAEFCMPFMTDQDTFGLLLLGSKADTSPYTATDVALLVSLARHLSLIINQIRLKNQVLQAQEIELMGRMSRGMAHDLNNLVTPIQTLLQLLNEGLSADDIREDLLPVAMRSVDTLREYVREALFFSQNARPDFKLGRLDVLLLEAADIIAPRCAQKAIRVEVKAPEEVVVQMDKSLIKRMVTNVLANAVDASPEGATITINLSRLTKVEKERDWLRVQIVDSGEGIKPEDLNRIFTPYFTTKNRGDQQRGFGLGLSICRKVVQLHGGSLKVMSQPSKGTTIQIDLPDHQVKAPLPPELASAA